VRLLGATLAATASLTLAAVCSACLGDECADVACEPCGPAVQLRVIDGATLEAVDGVRVESDDTVCMPREDGTHCSWGTEPGAYLLLVTAPGYLPTRVEITVPESDGSSCCDCGFVPQNVRVELEAS